MPTLQGKVDAYLQEVPGTRTRAAIRALITQLLVPTQNPPGHQPIVISAATTTGVTVSAATTTAVLLSGATTTQISVTGAFTTGLSIAADGTTAISVTSAFTGTTGLLFAGTATNGISITGDCTTAFDVTGAFTTGISIAADGTTGVEITSAFTGTTGFLLAGTATNGVSITGACATAAISITGAEAVGLLIATSTPTSGISISAACANGIAISGANTTAGINISGAEALGISINTSTPTDGILVSAACANAVSLTGSNTTAAISVSGTQVIGLSFAGTYSDSAITIGTSGSPISLAAQPDHAIDIYTTSPSTDAGNSVRPIHMTSTMAGIGGVGGRAEFEMTSNVALGGWANALKGYFNMGNACTVSGLGSAVLAEMKLPGASLGGVGSYGVLELELVTQASGLTGGAPVAFQWMQVSGDGTATADWEDNGYLMIIKGLTEGTGNIFSAGADVAAAATLRILVGSTPYYVLLATGEST